MRIKDYLALVLLLPALAACETVQSWDWFSPSSSTSSTEDARAVTVHTEAACPPVDVPAPAAQLALGGENPLDLRANVQLMVSASACTPVADGMRQHVTVQISASKGPALQEQTLAVPFFVATVDANNNVLTKKMYQTTFDFSSELTVTEELTVAITYSAAQAGSATTVAGLGIDPDSLSVAP